MKRGKVVNYRIRVICLLEKKKGLQYETPNRKVNKKRRET